MPKIVKSLTESKIKSLKVDPNQHQQISDGLGLYLFIHKTGYKYWKFDYSRPYTQKPNTISFGIYPTTSLAEAHIRRDEAHNRAKHLEKRKEMMQRWADYCGKIKTDRNFL